MNIVWDGPLPASNYLRGRAGNPITAIIVHWMAGSYASAIARFRDPSQQVSAHFLIERDGTIHQAVGELDTAYHAGEIGWNERSIGIEHEAGPTLPPTDALYAASAALVADICHRYDLVPVVGVTVKPHNSIVPTQCPGTIDLERIVKEATDMTDEEFLATFQRLYPGKIEETVKPTVRTMLEKDPETRLAVTAAVSQKLAT